MRSKESKGRSGSDGRRSPWDGAKTCRDHFWHLGWVPQKHEIVSRICCMMHVCCGRQMSVKGNWIRQLQPVLNVVPMAVTATRWAVVIVVTPTGPLPPWPYAKHSWHTAGSYFELSDLDDCGQFTLAEPMPCFNLCLVQYQWQHHIKPWSLWLANWQAKNRLRAIESMDVSVPWQSLSDLVSHFGLNPCLGTGHAICFVTRFADSSQITFANAKHVFLTDKTTKTTTIKFCKNGSAVCCLHNRTILVHTNVGGPNFFGFPSPTSLILGSVGHTTLPRRKLQANDLFFHSLGSLLSMVVRTAKANGRISCQSVKLSSLSFWHFTRCGVDLPKSGPMTVPEVLQFFPRQSLLMGFQGWFKVHPKPFVLLSSRVPVRCFTMKPPIFLWGLCFGFASIRSVWR